MEYRPLGNSGIDVSVICLGSMTWGRQNNEQDAHEQIDYSLTQGVNFIDTAEIYPAPLDEGHEERQGRTEQYIGTWFAKNPSKRSDIVLATKIIGASGFSFLRPDLAKNGRSVVDKANIISAVETSLQRLQTDYIDLYQVHWPSRSSNFFSTFAYTNNTNDETEDFAEIVETMDALKKQGKIRAWGVSNETPYGIMEYQRHADRLGFDGLVSVQNPYNLLNRIFEIGLSEIAIRNNMPLFAYSPLGTGSLTGKYLDGIPKNSRRGLFPGYWDRFCNPLSVIATRKYYELAKKYELDMGQMSLAFVNSRDFLCSNIIGATTMEQLKTNIASIDVKLPPELLKEIDAVHTENPNPAP